MVETLKDKLLKALIVSKQISQKDLDAAVALQKKKKVSLDKALIEKGLINEKDLLVLLIKELHIPSINLAKYNIDPNLKDIIGEDIARPSVRNDFRRFRGQSFYMNVTVQRDFPVRRR